LSTEILITAGNEVVVAAGSLWSEFCPAKPVAEKPSIKSAVLIDAMIDFSFIMFLPLVG